MGLKTVWLWHRWEKSSVFVFWKKILFTSYVCRHHLLYIKEKLQDYTKEDVCVCYKASYVSKISLLHSLFSQLDPSLESKVNIEKQPVMLEEEYTVRRDSLRPWRCWGGKMRGTNQQPVLSARKCSWLTVCAYAGCHQNLQKGLFARSSGLLRFYHMTQLQDFSHCNISAEHFEPKERTVLLSATTVTGKSSIMGLIKEYLTW